MTSSAFTDCGHRALITKEILLQVEIQLTDVIKILSVLFSRELNLQA